MNTVISDLNLKRFLPFIESVSGCECAIGLFKTNGKPQLIAYEGNTDSDINPIDSIPFKKINWEELNCDDNYVDLGNDGSLFIVDLQLNADMNSFCLAGIIKQSGCEFQSEQKGKISNTLKNIASCIAEDHTNKLALEGMADEIAVRYEELNLFYRMDDIDSHYKNKNEHEALNQLVNSCTDYLNVDMVALFVPDQEFSLHNVVTSDSAFELDLLVHTIQKPLYRFINSSRETLVINRDTDTDWTNANINIPYKFIASPILKSEKQVGGVLVLVNGMLKKDFTNSDRKLCEVLAAEASRLVQSRRDLATGLFNCRGFTELLINTMNRMQSPGQKSALLFVNINQFKIINDSIGRVAGDELICQMSALLTKELKKKDTLARISSDEFGVLLEDCCLSNARKIAERLLHVVKKFCFLYEDKMFDIFISIGVAEIDYEADNYSLIISNADLACSVAREQGVNKIHVCHSSDKDVVKHEDEIQWISKINLALEEGRFQIYRQTILPLQDNPSEEEHYEILLRLKDHNGELIPPFRFIPAAERYNIMTKLDCWVIKESLAKMEEVFSRQPDSNLFCSINLSGQSLSEEGFTDFIRDQITRSGVPANRLCFEITETAAVSNLSQVIKLIEELRIIGCKFSLDDFGSGMSSFTYLKNLPVDYLKIDGYFVKSMIDNKVDHAMVASINEIGHVMGLKTIAEFIEDDEILTEVRNMGIDYGQGYGIGKPVPFE